MYFSVDSYKNWNYKHINLTCYLQFMKSLITSFWILCHQIPIDDYDFIWEFKVISMMDTNHSIYTVVDNNSCFQRWVLYPFVAIFMLITYHFKNW